MNKIINSNPVDCKGAQITEGVKVFWTNPQRYESNGDYVVDSVEGDFAKLKHLDGTQPNYDFADFCDLVVTTGLK